MSGHSSMECYSSAEMQSMYTTAPADWARIIHVRLEYVKPIHYVQTNH